MSRWEPVNESLKKQRQSDGCGKLLVGAICVLVAGLVLALVLGFVLQPRCWACNHPRHEQRMCGWPVGGMGTCICEKDKR